MKIKSEKRITRKKKYIARGIIYGFSWYYEEVSYDSKTYESDNIKNLYKELKDGFDDKSMDSGFGFQSVLQADIEIGKVTTFKIREREFDHVVTKVVNIYKDDNNDVQIYDMTEWEQG